MDNSPQARCWVVHFCKHNLQRLKTTAFPHNKVGGIDSNSISDWVALDTFWPVGKSHAVLHAINLHSRASKTHTLTRAPKMQDAKNFLESLKACGVIGKNIVCDQGKEFDNSEVRQFCQLYGSQLFLTPKASWVNGTCERRHRVFRSVLHRLYYVFGQTTTLIPKLVEQATNAVNMTPTSALDGPCPYRVQWVINPHKLEPPGPEDLNGQQLVLMQDPEVKEAYQMRCEASAWIEKVKTDSQLVAEMKKLRETQRNCYKESDEVKQGELVEFFDKDKKEWMGPATLIHRQVNPDSVTFVVDHDGHYRRAHASHIRKHATASDMLLPPMLLKVLYKTHSMPVGQRLPQVGEFVEEEAKIKVVGDASDRRKGTRPTKVNQDEFERDSKLEEAQPVRPGSNKGACVARCERNPGSAT
ncbi:unnamed protein product [Amoebophrya sp. A120]|nr:unnamed protein product [Amoebophrya sp. A120]|eukprot:GSA120T00015360001.1